MNRSLDNLLRCLVGDKPKGWDSILSLEKFAYKNSVNRIIGRSSFQIMHGSSPRTILEIRKMKQGERISVEA